MLPGEWRWARLQIRLCLSILLAISHIVIMPHISRSVFTRNYRRKNSDCSWAPGESSTCSKIKLNSVIAGLCMWILHSPVWWFLFEWSLAIEWRVKYCFWPPLMFINVANFKKLLMDASEVPSRSPLNSQHPQHQTSTETSTKTLKGPTNKRAKVMKCNPTTGKQSNKIIIRTIPFAAAAFTHPEIANQWWKTFMAKDKQKESVCIAAWWAKVKEKAKRQSIGVDVDWNLSPQG